MNFFLSYLQVMFHHDTGDRINNRQILSKHTLFDNRYFHGGFGPRRAASEHDRLYNLADERTAFRRARPPRALREFAFFSQILEGMGREYCFL